MTSGDSAASDVLAALSALHALGVLWRQSWAVSLRARLTRHRPGRRGAQGAPPSCGGCAVWTVVQVATADGTVVTAWTVRPGKADGHEESGLW